MISNLSEEVISNLSAWIGSGLTPWAHQVCRALMIPGQNSALHTEASDIGHLLTKKEYCSDSFLRSTVGQCFGNSKCLHKICYVPGTYLSPLQKLIHLIFTSVDIICTFYSNSQFTCVKSMT